MEQVLAVILMSVVLLGFLAFGIWGPKADDE